MKTLFLIPITFCLASSAFAQTDLSKIVDACTAKAIAISAAKFSKETGGIYRNFYELKNTDRNPGGPLSSPVNYSVTFGNDEDGDRTYAVSIDASNTDCKVLSIQDSSSENTTMNSTMAESNLSKNGKEVKCTGADYQEIDLNAARTTLQYTVEGESQGAQKITHSAYHKGKGTSYTTSEGTLTLGDNGNTFQAAGAQDIQSVECTSPDALATSTPQ